MKEMKRKRRHILKRSAAWTLVAVLLSAILLKDFHIIHEDHFKTHQAGAVGQTSVNEDCPICSFEFYHADVPQVVAYEPPTFAVQERPQSWSSPGVPRVVRHVNAHSPPTVA